MHKLFEYKLLISGSQVSMFSLTQTYQIFLSLIPFQTSSRILKTKIVCHRTEDRRLQPEHTIILNESL